MNTWKRCRHIGEVSCAPGCGSSRRAMARVPSGQRDRSIRSVISATSAPSRSSLPSAGLRLPAPLRDRKTGVTDCFGQVEPDREPHVRRPAASTNPWVSAPESARAITRPREGRPVTAPTLGRAARRWSARVRPGVPGRSIPASASAGGVKEREQADGTRRCACSSRRPVLLGVRDHEGGVEVDHVETRIPARLPRPGPGHGSRVRDPGEGRRVDRFEGPPRCRGRGHLPEQPGWSRSTFSSEIVSRPQRS